MLMKMNVLKISLLKIFQQKRLSIVILLNS